MNVREMQVTLIDHMGSDLSVVNAARVSFAKESEWEYDITTDLSVEDEFGRRTGETYSRIEYDTKRLSAADAKLIKYLATHKHWTVFGHCFASFRIKAPIFVARQMVKHSVGLCWNEESRRYIDSDPEFWFPKVWRGRPEGSIKQGSAGEVDVSTVQVQMLTEACLQTYNRLLDLGAAPEQARMVLPINTMTEWIWSGSLAAWARVCNLRLDAHAQLETQEIAKHIYDKMQTIYPVSWKHLVGDPDGSN